MERKDLKRIEDIIGYNFNNLDLLQQAFVRKSYAEENGGEDNEILEFIGDKALDITIVKLLAERFGFFESNCDDYKPEEECDEFCCELSEGELTELKKKLVEKKMLSACIDRLQLADYLIMSEGDWNNKVYNSSSVKEDLFEAIIGAVTIDSNWDFEAIKTVVEMMLNPEYYFEEGQDENYVELIQEWTLKKTGEVPLYHYEEGNYTSTWYFHFDGISQSFNSLDSSTMHYINEIKYRCFLNLGDDLPIFRGFGVSKSDARKAVCELAYQYLDKNELLFSIQDEIENPNKNEAISQLEILARRGYFSIPKYDFVEQHNKDGNPVWTCICTIEEKEKSFKSKSSSKKEAKKSAAYKMLRYVLEEE